MVVEVVPPPPPGSDVVVTIPPPPVPMVVVVLEWPPSLGQPSTPGVQPGPGMPSRSHSQESVQGAPFEHAAPSHCSPESTTLLPQRDSSASKRDLPRLVLITPHIRLHVLSMWAFRRTRPRTPEHCSHFARTLVDPFFMPLPPNARFVFTTVEGQPALSDTVAPRIVMEPLFRVGLPVARGFPVMT